MDEQKLDRDAIKAGGWRFGSVFTSGSAPELAAQVPQEHKGRDAILIAVTHDCSILHPRLNVEPFLEYLSAHPVDAESGMLTHTRNPRRLQLTLIVDGDEQLYEMCMAERGFIDRGYLGCGLPDSRFDLLPESAATLRRWLGLRYTGHAFPDAFNQRIEPLIGGNKPFLKRLLEEPLGKYCDGLYVRLEPLNDELPADQSYRLDVVVLTYREEDLAALGGYDALQRFETEFKTCLEGAEGIEVGEVKALVDTDISLHDMRRLTRWQMDYISLRDSGDPTARVPPTD